MARWDVRSELGAMHARFRRRVRERGGELRFGEYGYRLAGPELVLCPAEFDFPASRADPERVYAGACVAGDPPECEREPLVYCSVGSHERIARDRERLFRALLELAPRRPRTRFVLQVKDDALRARLAPLPENVSVCEWASQLELLSKASVLVTHGGLSSVKEAIYCGVPLLVLPFFNDGFGNAARVRYHGIGLEGRMQSVTAARLHTALDRLGPASAELAAVRRLSRIFRSQADCATGVRHVARFLGGTR